MGNVTRQYLRDAIAHAPKYAPNKGPWGWMVALAEGGHAHICGQCAARIMGRGGTIGNAQAIWDADGSVCVLCDEEMRKDTVETPHESVDDDTIDDQHGFVRNSSRMWDEKGSGT